MNFSYKGMCVLEVGNFEALMSVGQENTYELPEGFTVLIAPNLAEKGVSVDGTTLRFGTEDVGLLVETDKIFQQIRVVILDDENVKRFGLAIKEDPELKAKQAEWTQTFSTFVEAIPTSGATGSLLRDLMSVDWAMVGVEAMAVMKEHFPATYEKATAKVDPDTLAQYEELITLSRLTA